MHRLLAFFLFLCSAALVQAAPSVALYYGQAIPLQEFRNFDIVVVEAGHGHDPRAFRQVGGELYAYVSVAEVQASRSYYKDIPAAWKMARNRDWGSEVIDQTPAAWPAFFAEKVVAPLWEKGYRGFFLDTLDSYRLARQFDEAAQQQGLIRVIETLHRRFPGIQLILNRGFEIVPAVRDKIRMVAAESLFRGWDAGSGRYREIAAGDREWLLGQLQTIRQRDGLDILAIDYVAPHDRALTRDTAARIAALGFIPWVSDGALERIGIGSIEVMPRRVLLVYDSSESPALNYTNAHRFLQMPLNHLGYIAEYADVARELPAGILPDRYAGVVTWFSGGIAPARHRPLARWLTGILERQLPLAIIGDPGFQLDRAFAARLGLRLAGDNIRLPLSVARQHPMLGFEAPPLPNRSDLPLFMATENAGNPLLTVRAADRQEYLAGALLPWGGFILDPFALVEIPGSDQARWVIDPFAFLKASLRLPEIPVPDVTTENGRRLFFSHVDGDGFPSLAELPGSPLAAEVLLTEIIERYKTPMTISVIEAETAPHGLFPKLSPALEDIARRIFRLPHVEIASHTYAHPFIWDRNVSGLSKNRNREEGIYQLDVPNYRYDPVREIVGSIDYIRERLAPPGKPVSILLWSGDTAPDAEALRVVENAGYLNLNGGDTSITRNNPSLTAVGAHGIEKDGHLQVYAPITNENIYTNLWRGPYYGYERVIESFEMTGSPRRLKPVDIYYHTYSASKRAGLTAVHKAFAWTRTQALHPVFASEFIRKVQDFHAIAIARDQHGWLFRGNGELRTLRWSGAPPRLADAQGVIGHNPGPEGSYIHLTGASARFAVAADAARTPRLYDANARIAGHQNGPGGLGFALKGHVPIEFSLADSQACQVRADGRSLTPHRTVRHGDTAVQEFRLAHAAAQIQLLCPAR